MIELAHLSHSYSLAYQFDKIPVKHISITRCAFNPIHDLVAISNKDKCLFIFSFSSTLRKNAGAVMYIYNIPKNTQTKRHMYITNLSWSPDGLYLLLQTTDGTLTCSGYTFYTNHSDIKLFKYFMSAHIIRKLSLKNYIRCQATTQTSFCWLSNDSFFVTRRFMFDTKLLRVSLTDCLVSETLLVKSFTTLTNFSFTSYPPQSPYNQLEIEYIASLVYSSAFPDNLFYIAPCLSSQPNLDRHKHSHNSLIKYSLALQQPISVIHVPGYIQKVLANDAGIFFTYSKTLFTNTPLMEKSSKCPVCPLFPSPLVPSTMQFVKYTTAGLTTILTPR